LEWKSFFGLDFVLEEKDKKKADRKVRHFLLEKVGNYTKLIMKKFADSDALFVL
jgi:hypothetical protein